MTQSERSEEYKRGAREAANRIANIVEADNFPMVRRDVLVVTLDSIFRETQPNTTEKNQ